MKRLLSEQRTKLEQRHKALKTVIAAMEAGKVSDIVDGVSVDNPNIQDVVEKIMKIMQAEPEAAKYHTASKKTTIARFFKKALEMMTKEDESPEEEAHDLSDPAIHIFEDAEHEAQTMDDPTLVKEVQDLEDHVKDILNRHDEKHKDAPHGEHPVGSSEVPKNEKNHDSEAKDGMATQDSPEHKLAKLKALPKAQRLAKAAKLYALANELSAEEKEVSNNHNNDGKPSDALMNDYKDEEMGSMKDVQAAKKDIKTLLAAMDNMDKMEEKDEDKKEEEKVDKTASILKLALRHLYASIEDMEEEKNPDSENWKKEEDKEKDMLDKEANQDLDESEGGKPNWLQDKQEEAEKEEKSKDEDKEEKKAALRARIRENLNKKATVDGKNMATPKDVVQPEGTTEDTLKGDAKIQYSTNNGGSNEISTKHVVPSKDVQIAGSDEPNAVYSTNSAGKNVYTPSKDDDAAKDVTNKRQLGDNESAVQKSVPSSPKDGMEKGEGSHSKTLDWASEKEKADMTPTGDRLVGLASLIKERTTRASKLASKMYGLGFIKSESQFADEIAKLASFDDKEFQVAESLFSNLTKTSSKRVVAEEMSHEDEMNEEHDDESDEKEMKKEARLRRQASQRAREDKGETRSISNVASQGLRRPLFLSSDEANYNPGKSDIANKVANAFNGQWTDPIKVANQKLSILDVQASGEINLESFTKNS